MKKLLLAMSLALAGSADAQTSIPSFSDHKLLGFPDLNQKDPLFKLFDDGKAACGPTSAANGLIWLSKHGFGNLVDPGKEAKDIVRELDELSFRQTLGKSLGDGTFELQLQLALVQYVSKRSYKKVSVFSEGDIENGKAPDLKKIKAHIDDPNSVVLLNLGWFRKDGEDVQLEDGHWVTGIGFGQRRNPSWNGFYVSDPDDGKEGVALPLSIAPVKARNILFKNRNLLTQKDRVPAREFVAIGEGILKTAVVIKMDPTEKK